MIFIIGIAGGSGSGKTTLAQAMVNRMEKNNAALIPHDCYYKDQSHLSYSERTLVNYDHPDALDNELLSYHLTELRKGKPIELPIYDFTTHTRREQTKRIAPKRVIIVDGILILADENLRKLLDMKIFVDVDADIRFIRRLQRDIAYRGRTAESVIIQYLNTVRPMHQKFVEPSKKFADFIVSGEDDVEGTLDMFDSLNLPRT